MASKVYFTNFRATYRENLPKKLARLVKTAGMLDGIDFNNKNTAIKSAAKTARYKASSPEETGMFRTKSPNVPKIVIDAISIKRGFIALCMINGPHNLQTKCFSLLK